MADLYACYSPDWAASDVAESNEMPSFNTVLGAKACRGDAAEKETFWPDLPFL